MLELSDGHRQGLRNRGLGEANIDRSGYRTAGRFAIQQAVGQLKQRFDEATLLRVPGFQFKKDKVRFSDVEGLIVPVRDQAGRIVALKIRRDGTVEGPKYLWISSNQGGGPSPGSPCHIPVGTPSHPGEVRLTEGELKADVSFALSGMPTIGVSGVSNWRPCLSVLRALGVKTVHLAFDADAREKLAVARELEACARELIRAGFEIRLETWPSCDGKGIDDLLAAGKKPEVLELGRALAAIAELVGGPTGMVEGEEEDWVPDEGRGAVAGFPTDCLPEPVAGFVNEVSRSIQCPTDFAGLGVLAVAATAIGGSRRLRIRRGFEVSPTFYTAIVARPGDGKSPALRAACSPVYNQQDRWQDEYDREKARFQADLEAYEAARRRPRGDDELPIEAPVKPGRPLMRHAYAGDITTEGLALVLAKNRRGILMIRDELTGWVMAMNQYRGGRGADRQFYLSCWSGEPAKVDRKSDSGDPLIIPNPSLSIVGCIPPSMLAELDAGNDGEDGFIHRVLFAFPDRVPRRRWDWQGLSSDVTRDWEQIVSRLYQLPMQNDEFGRPSALVLDLAPEACRAWEAWYNSHAEESEAPDFPETLIGPWSKLIVYAARLALVIHLLRQASGEDVGDDVGLDSLERSLELIAYFKSHARVVYAQLRQTTKAKRAKQASDWIRKHGNECNPTHLARNNVAGVQKKSEAEELMKELEDRGYGRCEIRKAGNNHKVTWFVAKQTNRGKSGPVGSPDPTRESPQVLDAQY